MCLQFTLQHKFNKKNSISKLNGLWRQPLIIIIIIIIIKSLEFFFISALADGLSLEFEWQQVSSSLQDSS